jgi:predicted ABC-type ATPase
LITVLAGVNGAGKSSIAGSSLRANGAAYLNPDEETLVLMRSVPGLSLEHANERVWQEGVKQLRAAIANDTDWVFETTLGGRTIPDLLLQANEQGIAVQVWYCGLNSAEKHIERVRQRVARGGHDIPEDRIRYRYVTSLKNICRLAPVCDVLAVYDNSRDMRQGERPSPERIMQATRGRIDYLHGDPPRWAQPVIGALLPPTQA